MKSCWRCGDEVIPDGSVDVECDLCARGLPVEGVRKFHRQKPEQHAKVDWNKVKTLEDFKLVTTVAPMEVYLIKGSPAHKLLERFV